MIGDPYFYALAIPAFLLVGVAKGGFGAGLGSLGVPMMALAVPVPQAAAIMLPLLCAMDVMGLRVYRGIWDRPNLAIMMPGALVGLALGYLAFRHLDEAWIRLLVGVIALGFSLNYWRRPYMNRPPAGRSWLRGGLWSALSGLTSFVANSGGPPISVYLLPQRLDKTVFVGTTVVFFATVNALKIVPYWWLGQFTPENLTTSLVLLPVAVAGMGLGIRLHRRVDERSFYGLAHGLLLVAGVKLAWDGLAGVL
ncbi:MAG: sulfite exporter TauE/SafE family protein [Pseudomonadota bacterium]